MRLFSKIFSITLVLFVLSILYLPSVKAGCSFDAYGNCTGTCSCFPYCGSCNCKAFSTSFCVEDKSTCYPCPTNTPKPTNTPQPTYPDTSPTETPVPTPKECKTTQDCEPLCRGIPNCSATCQNGYCYTTNPTAQPTNRCNTWGNWSACMSGQDTCSACAAQGYTCQTRFCANPSNSYLYQISCGCSQPPGGGGGGGGGSNTTYLSLQLLDPNLNVITPPVRLYCPPTPIFSPTPTPTFPPYCYFGSPIPGMPGATLPPNTSPCPTQSFDKTFDVRESCYFQHPSLCKVRCDTTPCISVACEQDVSYANFKGVPANQGASMFDLYLPSLASHLVQ
jgi:hypothetical protein